MRRRKSPYLSVFFSLRALGAAVVVATSTFVMAFVVISSQGCSSDTTSTTPATATDSGVEGDAPHQRVLACSPATDAGAQSAIEAGVTAKISKPTNGQTFKTTDRITFQGTGADKVEGNITDPERMIWNIVDPVKGPTPDGEGPEDTAGPYAAGSYVIRFDVSNKACLTAADAVTITVE